MGLRPEDVGDYTIWCFNQAVAYLGMTIENELDSVEGRNKADIEAKHKAVLRRYLGDLEPGDQGKGSFADPALLFAAQSGG